jgi:hypothetical protein
MNNTAVRNDCISFKTRAQGITSMHQNSEVTTHARDADVGENTRQPNTRRVERTTGIRTTTSSVSLILRAMTLSTLAHSGDFSSSSSVNPYLDRKEERLCTNNKRESKRAQTTLPHQSLKTKFTAGDGDAQEIEIRNEQERKMWVATHCLNSSLM